MLCWVPNLYISLYMCSAHWVLSPFKRAAMFHTTTTTIPHSWVLLQGLNSKLYIGGVIPETITEERQWSGKKIKAREPMLLNRLLLGPSRTQSPGYPGKKTVPYWEEGGGLPTPCVCPLQVVDCSWCVNSLKLVPEQNHNFYSHVCPSQRKWFHTTLKWELGSMSICRSVRLFSENMFKFQFYLSPRVWENYLASLHISPPLVIWTQFILRGRFVRFKSRLYVNIWYNTIL